MVLRRYLLFTGYTMGTTFLKEIAGSGAMKILTKGASILGLIMVGAMIASNVNGADIKAGVLGRLPLHGGNKPQAEGGDGLGDVEKGGVAHQGLPVLLRGLAVPLQRGGQRENNADGVLVILVPICLRDKQLLDLEKRTMNMAAASPSTNEKGRCSSG